MSCGVNLAFGTGSNAFKKRICNINETTGEIQPLAAGAEVIADDEDIYPDRNGRDRFAYSWTVDALYYCGDVVVPPQTDSKVTLVAMGFTANQTYVIDRTSEAITDILPISDNFCFVKNSETFISVGPLGEVVLAAFTEFSGDEVFQSNPFA